jgi:hypothetical protein
VAADQHRRSRKTVDLAADAEEAETLLKRFQEASLIAARPSLANAMRRRTCK